MPRDSLNDANWAYWHYGQQHLDSAAYYFQKMLGRYKWGGEVETLRILAEIEEQRGDLRASLSYYKRLAEAEDSLKVQQRAEETMRTEAQFNYTSIQQERDRLEHRNAELSQMMRLVGLAAVACMVVAVIIWITYRQRRTAAQKQWEAEKEGQQRRSLQQMEENRRQLATLQQLLDEVHRQNDRAAAKRLQMEADVLATQNMSIEASLRRKEALLAELKQTELYRRLKASAHGEGKRLSEDDWHELATRVDDIYRLGPQLRMLAHLSESELRICYLLKIGISPAEIAGIVNRTKSAVSMARQRMVVKLTGRKGGAEMLDEIMVGF